MSSFTDGDATAAVEAIALPSLALFYNDLASLCTSAGHSLSGILLSSVLVTLL